jgi:uncharacterized repeat protein (TIGR02543 family)
VIKKNLRCFGLFAALGLLCVIVSCEDSSAPETPAANYTVSFLSDGITLIADKTVREGTTLALTFSEYQPEERSGYFFDGWYVQDDTEQTILDRITVNKNITLVAKWVDPISITLDMQGGELVGDPGSNLRPGTTFEAAWYVPAKRGYVFLHWYLQGDLSRTAVETIQVAAGITLVAEWEAGWVVTFELNGGEYPDEFITVTKGALFELSSIRPVKDDYVLEGWYSDGAFVFRSPNTITVVKDITLYAKWVPLDIYSPMFGVWKGSAGTYLLHHDPNGSGLDSADSLIGFFLSADEIRSFVWTDSTIDGKASSLDSDTLTLGEGESASTFTRVTTKTRPAGNVSLSKVWTKGEGSDPLSIFLFEDGGGILYANGRVVDISYAGSRSTLHLLRHNTNANGDLLDGEVLLTIPVLQDDKGRLKPDGFTEMGGGWGEEVGGGEIVPF